MHTVVETRAYLVAATRAGMTERERESAVALLSRNPDAGDLIVGSGGVRKVRVGGRGKGKSGGYRVLTLFKFADFPVFLLDVFAKGDKANVSEAEVQAMAKAVREIIEEFRK